jgi:CheY-like chemotaxis protein
VKELQPDIGLMDITMPDMDGLEATEKSGGFTRCKNLVLTIRE